MSDLLLLGLTLLLMLLLLVFAGYSGLLAGMAVTGWLFTRAAASPPNSAPSLSTRKTPHGKEPPWGSAPWMDLVGQGFFREGSFGC